MVRFREGLLASSFESAPVVLQIDVFRVSQWKEEVHLVCKFQKANEAKI